MQRGRARQRNSAVHCFDFRPTEQREGDCQIVDCDSEESVLFLLAGKREARRGVEDAAPYILNLWRGGMGDVATLKFKDGTV